MMNVRVRRCRTKKIGVATGPEQITYPSTTPKAIEANRTGTNLSPEPRGPPPQGRLTLTGSVAYPASVPSRHKIETGNKQVPSGALSNREDSGDGLKAGTRTSESDQPHVDQPSRLRVDHPMSGGGPFSPGSGEASLPGAIPGVPTAPWHLQQQESLHGSEQIMQGVSMPV